MNNIDQRKQYEKFWNLNMYRLAVLLSLIFCHSSFAEYRLTQPPVNESVISSLHYFIDRNGNLNLAYQRENPETPNDFFHVIENDGNWSSAISVFPSSTNQRELNGVKTLSNGTPLLIMTGDNTDYSVVFNLSEPIQIPEDETENIIPGISNEELDRILLDNQRLFFSFQTASGWSAPLPIVGTRRAQNPVLHVGGTDNAIIVFEKDQDNQQSTLNDRELYFSVYRNNVWSQPTRLTDNDSLEYAVQIQFTDDRFVMAWLSDQDSDLSTTDDKAIYYASVLPQGTLQNSPGIITNDVLAGSSFTLGQQQNEALLLWASQTIQEGAVLNNVMQSKFDGAWSTAEHNGLFAPNLQNGKIYQLENNELLFVYMDGSNMQSAFNNGQDWSYAGLVTDILATNLKLSEVNHVMGVQDKIHIALAAHIPEANDPEDEDDSEVPGLYTSIYNLLPELKLTVLGVAPKVKRIGEDISLKLSVTNSGLMTAQPYQLQLKNNGNSLATLNGNILAPGAEQVFEYNFKLENSITPVEFIISSGGVELSEYIHIINVLPDFYVDSVSTDVGQITADIREVKGVSSPPVSVDFYLTEAGKRTKIGSGEFDPNIALPVKLDWPELANKTSEYRIEVEVNHQRSVKEDLYSNNNNSFSFKPASDLVVSQLYFSGNQVNVTIRNNGSIAVQQTRLIITSNPAIASNTDGSLTAEYNEVIDLGDNQQAQFTANLTNSLSAGDTLYAVVNPYGEVAEANRNNNRHQQLILEKDLQAENPNDPDSEASRAELVFGDMTSWCGNLNINLSNNGEAVAVSPVIRIFNQQRLVAQQTLGAIAVNANESAIFTRDMLAEIHGGELNPEQELVSGGYQVQISYSSVAGNETISDSIDTYLTAVACDAGNEGESDERFISINREEIAIITDENGTRFVRVSFSAPGYPFNYRKPLLRVSAIIEVMDGLDILYRTDEVVYIPAEGGNIYTKDFALPEDILQSDNAKVRVRVPVRDDDTTTTDNVQTTLVNF